MKEIFVLKSKCMYNTREIFVTHNVRTEHYGKETLSYLGPKIWNIIPNERWKPDKCPCKLCKTYVAVGFID